MVFEWDAAKEAANIGKCGIGFSTVPAAFEDPGRLIIPNSVQSAGEARLYCIGHDGRGTLTVRFTLRGGKIIVIGAGYWKKQAHEKANRRL